MHSSDRDIFIENKKMVDVCKNADSESIRIFNLWKSTYKMCINWRRIESLCEIIGHDYMDLNDQFGGRICETCYKCETNLDGVGWRPTLDNMVRMTVRRFTDYWG